jgi:methylmalonyl-CoA/ethylmalonyl-CoA epimerase
VILRLDHVAFAVWDMPAAAGLWREALGGEYRQGGTKYRGFNFLQFAWPEGGRVEVLSPANDDSGFVARFLNRYGEGVHHLTLIADDLRSEVDRLRESGVRIFGEDYGDPRWMEAFVNAPLRGPRLLVQLAQSSLSVEEQDQLWRRQPLGSVLEVASR